MTRGEWINAIALERVRQIDEKGWSAEHDDMHLNGELAQAAAVLALPPQKRNQEILGLTLGSLLWPWGSLPNNRHRERELVKAAALIVAELERITRAYE